MGNCCMRSHGHDSNMVWAGDDWGSPMSERFTSRESSRHYSDEKPKKMMRRKNTEYDLEAEDENKETYDQKQRSSSSLLLVDEDDHYNNKNVMMMNSSTEVKVKITKKQLEELLGNVQVKGLSVQELFGQLMNVTNTTTTTTHDSKHRPWRPVLQSIPETTEAV